MTLQNSGRITFGQIRNEFGMPPGKNLGAYRVSYSNTGEGGSLSGLPLDDGVPQSGTIRFSDFYGKRMNTVVDCYSLEALKQLQMLETNIITLVEL